MKWIKPQESWGRLIAQLIGITVLILLFACWFTQRFKIGYDPQRERCLPNHAVYLIDMNDKALHPGETYAFSSLGLQPIYPDGTTMVKILSAMPGDQVEVNEAWEIKVNGRVLQNGLHMARRLNLTALSFIGKGVLADNEYWFLGQSRNSFDSRYWGTVKGGQIIGRAYPLF